MNAANDSMESSYRNYKLFTIILATIQTNEHVYISLLNILSEGRVYQQLIEKIKTSYEKFRIAIPQSLQRERAHHVTGMSVLIVTCSVCMYMCTCEHFEWIYMYVTHKKNKFLLSHATDSKQH